MSTRFAKGLLLFGFILTSIPCLWAAQIGGLVRDRNTGARIPNVVVRVTAVVNPSQKYETVTSRDGSYVIKVKRGRYQVQAIAAGTDYLPAFYALPQTPQTPGIIDLTAEDVFSFAHIDLELGGSIEGRVLQLSDGQPLPGIRVSAEAPGFRQTTVTDFSGRYLLRALPRGDYWVQAGALDPVYIPIYFPRSDFAERATRISVQPGERISGIHLKLQPGASIQGRILSATTNQPLPDITVIADPIQPKEPERITATDRSGFFTLTGLRGGKYIVEAGAEHSGEANGPKKYVTQFYDHTFDRELAQAVEVELGATRSGVDFSLYQGNRIRGRVRSVYLNSPLAGAMVRAVSFPESALRLPLGQAATDGNYLIDDLPPGQYQVTVDVTATPPPHVPVWYRDQLVKRKATLLSLRDGDTYSNVDFNLRLGAGVSGRASTDDSDYLLDYKKLHVELSIVGNEIDGLEPRLFDFTEEGRYSITGMPSGRFYLALKSEDPNLSIHPVSDTKTILLSEGRELHDVDFSVRVGGSISGKITLKRSRLPLDRYQVLLLRMNDPFHQFYKLQGDTYTLPGLRSGKYIVVLVEEQEPMTLEKLFSTPRFYDSRIVEVKKGLTVTNVDFVIDETRPLSIP